VNFLDKLENPLKMMKSFAESAPIGVQIYNAEGYSLYVNPKHIQMFGAAPPPEYCCLYDENVAKAGHIGLVHRAFKGETVQLPAFWYDPRELPNFKDYTATFGKKCAIETRLVPIFGTSGAVSYVVFFHRDVTAEMLLRAEREAAVKERDEALRQIQILLDQTQAVIFMKDMEGRYLFVNRQFCHIFRLSKERILGLTDYDLFPKDVADGFVKNDIHVRTTGENLEVEENAVHHDGSTHRYLSLKFPMRDPSGKIIGSCGVASDISQMRAMQLELARAKKMESLGLLAGGIAHDFNNMLGSILLTADTILLRNKPLKMSLREEVESIKSAANSAALMARRLLDFGQGPVSETSRIDLGETVLRIRKILANAMGEDVAFFVDIEKPLWKIQADPGQMDQMLTNLCFNAREAMPRGGTLRIEVGNLRLPEGRFVCLKVKDSGCGISAPDLDRIFEPFFTTKKDGHTGLGLATVYTIVKAAAGNLEVVSEPGLGTEFRIMFPARRALTKKPKGPKTKTAQVDGGTILLVEDHPGMRKATAAVLKRSGYQVFEAADAKAALQIWKKHAASIDLIVTDIVMPDTSGPEMVRIMQKLKPDARVNTLFVSAYSDKKLSDYDFSQYTVFFIEKPYTADDLLEKIRKVIVRA
jgi:two-component system, cell cycle sensor histidine kinase and response regulator CckA